MEVLSELVCGHEFEEDVSEHALPAGADLFESEWRNDPFEEVEQTPLLGINGMTHANHNSIDILVL